MFGSIRNALVAGVIAALGLVGVSYATTGSINPAELVTGESPAGTTGATGATATSGGTGVSGPSGWSGPSGPSGPTGPAATHGPPRSTEDCEPAGFTGNHGQFVSSRPKGDRSEAARSDCGKPVRATQKESNEAPDPGEAPELDGNDDHGHHGQPGEKHGRSGDHGQGDADD